MTAAIESMLKEEQLPRRTSEEKLIATFDKQLKSLRKQVEKEYPPDHEVEKVLQKHIEENIPQLHEALAAETTKREELETQLIGHLEKIVKGHNEELEIAKAE